MAIPNSHAHVDVDPCSFLAASKPSARISMRWLCEDTGETNCLSKESVVAMR